MQSSTKGRASAPHPAERFVFVDGLRGIASTAVMFYHYAGYFTIADLSLSGAARTSVAIASYGPLGIEIFFVLSGFVIAHSLRSSRFTAQEAGRFVLRRSLRIDPPYWATILVLFGLALVGKLTGRGTQLANFSGGQLLAHVFYLQDILGYPAICPVFWTLCLEVQFYLTFVTMGLIVQYMSRWGRWQSVSRAHAGLVVLLFAVSIGLALAAIGTGPWFLGRWYMFGAGAIAYWVAEDHLPSSVGAAALASLVTLAFVHPSSSVNAAILTALSLFVALRTRRMGTWLSAAPLQFFGRISYSLYLIHGVVGAILYFRFKNLIVRGEPMVWLFLAVALPLAVWCAWIMYRLIELPTTRLAKRVGRTPSVPPAEAPPSTASPETTALLASSTLPS